MATSNAASMPQDPEPNSIASTGPSPVAPQVNSAPTSQEKKPTQYLWTEDMNSFVMALDYYQPTIPEPVIQYLLQKSGVNVIDKLTLKTVALAADKHLAETINDASQFGQFAHPNQPGGQKKRKPEAMGIMRTEDLERALALKRCHVKIPKLST